MTVTVRTPVPETPQSRLFVHVDGRPMVFYVPESADKDRISDLIRKGGGAITTQPGVPPSVFTLMAPGAVSNNSSDGLTPAFVEACMHQQHLHDWRMFLIRSASQLSQVQAPTLKKNVTKQEEREEALGLASNG